MGFVLQPSGLLLRDGFTTRQLSTVGTIYDQMSYPGTNLDPVFSGVIVDQTGTFYYINNGAKIGKFRASDGVLVSEVAPGGSDVFPWICLRPATGTILAGVLETVREYDPTNWTLVRTFSNGFAPDSVFTMAVNGSTLLYTSPVFPDQTGKIIHRHDLASDTPLADLYSGTSFQNIWQIIALPDGGAVGGNNTPDYPPEPNTYKLFRVDSSGTVVWSQNFDATTDTAIWTLSLTADGTGIWAYDRFQGASNPGRLFLVDLATGAILQTFPFATVFNGFGMDTIPAAAGSALVTGLSVGCALNRLIITGTRFQSGAAITVMDPNGNPITDFTLLSLTDTQIVLQLQTVPFVNGAYCVTVENP